MGKLIPFPLKRVQPQNLKAQEDEYDDLDDLFQELNYETEEDLNGNSSYSTPNKIAHDVQPLI